LRINRLSILLLLGLLQACVAVNPQPSQNEKASAVNVQLGIGYLQQNKLELASEKLTKAVRQDPKSAAAHNAYAILQDRLQQYDLAEYHYERATELDPKDSQAANNYGTFLCRHGREREAEKYFIQATRNPLYRTPEYAYTNAAICLKKVGESEAALEYLRKALASKSDFAAALIAMADIQFEAGDYDSARLYIDRYHLVARPSAKSLWLAIQNSLQLDGRADVSERVNELKTRFPDSEEYKAWLQSQ